MGLLITTTSFGEKRSHEKSVESAPQVTAFVAFNEKHGLLGHYRFDKNGRTFTINSECYIAILDQFHGDLTQ